MKHGAFFLALGLTLGVATVPRDVVAQDRGQLIRDALNAFAPDEARTMLRQALDPALGPPDSIWGVGAQLMAQLFIDDGETELASVWLRWALRLNPGIVSNTLDFTQDVADALAAARARVGADTVGLAVTRTTWTWVTNVREGPGLLRVEPVVFPVAATVVVERRGVLTSAQPLSLPAGTYGFQISAPGYAEVRIEREVLPGMTTNIGFSLATAVVAEAVTQPDVMPDAVDALVRSQTVRLAVRAAVGYSFCGTGFWADPNGFVVTTYRAIRGADAVDVTLSNGTIIRDAVVAAYDVARNVAVLSVGAPWRDSLPVARTVANGDFVWAARYPGCGQVALARTTVGSGGGGSIALGGAVSDNEQGGPLVTRSGTVIGVGVDALSAASFSVVTDLLAEAQANAQTGNLISFVDIAAREQHRIGAVRLTPPTGALGLARVSRMQPVPWEGLDRSAEMPFTYFGPEGRYLVELIQNGRTMQSEEITINGGVLGTYVFQLTPSGGQVTSGGGGFPVLPVVLLAAGGGVAAAVLGGGGGGGGVDTCPAGQIGTPPNCTTPPTTGNIIVSFPANPSLRAPSVPWRW